jgi:aminoglycoside phosphotransferase family enzyme
MDLEYHSGHRFAELLLDSYTSFSGETGAELEQILKYYKVYRAYVWMIRISLRKKRKRREKLRRIISI